MGIKILHGQTKLFVVLLLLSCFIIKSPSIGIESSSSNFEGLLKFALEITRIQTQQAGLENTPQTLQIPATWIFPLQNETKMTNTTLINTQESTKIKSVFVIPSIIFSIDKYRTILFNETRIFPYSHEFSVDDVINPTNYGVLHFNPNYASIFIQCCSSNNGEDLLSDTIETIVKYKYGRPHKDYFFFIGESKAMIEELFERNKKLVDDIRYKIVVIRSIQQQQQQQPHTLINNYCTRNQIKSSDLFSRACDPAIRNKHYVVSACNLPAMIRPESKSNKHDDGGGMIYAMFLEASLRHNFTFSSHIAPFNGASGFKKNGTWYGALGEVLRRDADVAFAVGITVDRLKIADPTASQVRIERVFYIHSPPLIQSSMSLFWPLQLHLWILTILLTIFIILPVFYYAARCYFKLDDEMRFKYTHQGITKRPKYLLFEVVDALYRILMEQAATVRHWKGSYIRILIIIWATFCLVLETGYRSKLVTFLTFLDHEEVPRTHEDLTLSNFKLYFRYYGGVAYQYAKNSNSSMHQRLLSKIELIDHSHECIQKALLTQNSACLDYSLSGDFAIATNSTLYPNQDSKLFIKSLDTDFKSTIVWAFRKGSPFTESFDKIVLNSLAAGLFEYWKNTDFAINRINGIRWLKTCKEERNPAMSNNNKGVRNKIENVLKNLNIGPKALDLSSLSGMFYLYGFGALISSGAWMVEYVIELILQTKVKKILRK